MANESKKNVYWKLIEARKLFLDAKVKKSGKNIHLEFKYFELSDIIPVAVGIFDKLGLVDVTTFTNEEAKLTIFDCDKPEDKVEFTAPVKTIQAIVSNQGKVVTNEVQTLGSSITYYRRYLLQLALNICEDDDLDASAGNEPKPENETKKRTSSKQPATVEERKEIKEELTNVEDKASELQISALKKALKKLIGVDPTKKKFVEDYLKKTNNFTTLTKKQAEMSINNINDVIEEIEHPSINPEETEEQ